MGLQLMHVPHQDCSPWNVALPRAQKMPFEKERQRTRTARSVKVYGNSLTTYLALQPSFLPVCLINEGLVAECD